MSFPPPPATTTSTGAQNFNHFPFSFKAKLRHQVLQYHVFSPLPCSIIKNIKMPRRKTHHSHQRLLLISPPRASIARQPQGSDSNYYSSGTYDPELRAVLELATDSELCDIERILFSTSYFSPLLKSITKRADVDYVTIGEDPEERGEFISMLESRFLYLAADARSTLRGWRPTYRKVLLGVRKKLNIPCSAKLSTEDLEVEIFLHLLQDFSSEQPQASQGSRENQTASDGQGSLELGLNQWKIQAAAALGIGAVELRSLILKGGGVFTLGKLYDLLARRLSGKVLKEAANYQIKKEIIKKGGQLAAINLESRVALLAAKQGVTGAASRYIGLRSMVTFLGPMLWGTLLADIVIQMLGTDYARIIRAIYAFAQIRITRTYKLPSDIL